MPIDYRMLTILYTISCVKNNEKKLGLAQHELIVKIKINELTNSFFTAKIKEALL